MASNQAVGDLRQAQPQGAEIAIERDEYRGEQNVRPDMMVPHVFQNEDEDDANGEIEHGKKPEPEPQPAIHQIDT